MFQDYKDLLSAFHAHGVKYLVVGGYAVIFHAQPRFTRDIDLLIQTDETNAQAVYAALAAFGMPLAGIQPKDFEDPNTFFRFGLDPHGVDILSSIPGIEFDGAWERRVEGVIDPQDETPAYFISLEDLITAKLASGRLRDLADVEELRSAKESGEPPS